jgi:hypothetical protein
MNQEAIIFLGSVDYACPENVKWVRGLRKYAGFHKIYISGLAGLSSAIHDYFDQVIEVDDIMNFERVAGVMRELQAAYTLRQVFWYYEFGVYLTGRLRSELGIRGMQEPIAKAVRNKFIMKEIVRSHGINTSRVRYAQSAADAVMFADEFGWPIVAKPVDGAATLFVKILHDAAEAEAYFEEFAITNEYLRKVIKNRVLVETFSQGREYVVDAVVKGDKVVFSNVAAYLDNCVDAVARGAVAIYPLPIEDDLTRSLVAMNGKVVAALGLTNTVTHAEFFVNEATGEIKFGEIAARVGANELYPEVLMNCYGVDFAELAFDTVMENVGEIRPHVFRPTAGFSLPKKPGLLKSVASLADLQEVADVVEYRLKIRPGDDLGVMDSTIITSGILIITAPTIAQLRTDMDKVLARFLDLMIVESR